MRAKGKGLLLFAMLLAVSLYFFLQSGVFSVRQVEVKGRSILSEEDVLTYAGVARGLNIFKLDLERIKENLKLHPVVEDVLVSRELPATVVIEVRERKPLAVVPFGGEFVIVDRGGVYLRRVNSLGKAPNLPVLTGVAPPDNWGPGMPLAAPNLQGAVEVIESLDPRILSRISEVNAANEYKYLLYTLDGVEIRMGNREALEQKGHVLGQLLLQGQEGKKIQYIDVSYVDNPAIMYK